MRKLPGWVLPLGLILTFSGGLWGLVYMEIRDYLERERSFAGKVAQAELTKCGLDLSDFEGPEVNYFDNPIAPDFIWFSKGGPPHFAVVACTYTETAWVYKTNADGEIIHYWSCDEE